MPVIQGWALAFHVSQARATEAVMSICITQPHLPSVVRGGGTARTWNFPTSYVKWCERKDMDFGDSWPWIQMLGEALQPLVSYLKNRVLTTPQDYGEEEIRSYI